MDYCKYYNLKIELDEYVADCMKLRDSGVQKYAQYFHGGALPTLEK